MFGPFLLAGHTGRQCLLDFEMIAALEVFELAFNELASLPLQRGCPPSVNVQNECAARTSVDADHWERNQNPEW
jgi:hypothetical protein